MPRLLLVLAFALCASAQTLEQAAERLAAKVASTMRPGPPAAISVENRSWFSMSLDHVRALLENRINEGKTASDGAPAVKAYITESASGQLLIATSECGESPCVSMERFQSNAAVPRSTLTLRPVVQQNAPILDFTLTADSVVLLEPARVVVRRSGGKLSLPFTPAIPMPRDPRGRLFVRDGAYEVRIPGSLCTGREAISCKADDSPWREGDMQVSWTPRRNILVLPNGVGGEDIAFVQSECGASRLTAMGDSIEAPGAQRIMLPGDVTALWSSETPTEASLVVFNSDNGQYEASRVALRCDR